MPPREPWIFRLGPGYIALMRGAHPRGFRYAEPVEAYWGLAPPLIGSDPAELAAELEDLLAGRSDEWDVLALSGLVEGSPLLEEVRSRLARRYRVGIAGRTERYVASLEGGLEGFLARRSKNARRSMKRAARDARLAGVRFEEVSSGAPGIFERILDIERRSWKGAARVGITEPPMRDFYRLMVPRLARSGRLRLGFAREGDRDVGYVLGAVFGDRYRGLQFSFDAGVAHASVGNAMQLAQIERLAADGIRSYDLGATGGGYKARWSDEPVSSVALLVIAD